MVFHPDEIILWNQIDQKVTCQRGEFIFLRSMEFVRMKGKTNGTSYHNDFQVKLRGRSSNISWARHLLEELCR